MLAWSSYGNIISMYDISSNTIVQNFEGAILKSGRKFFMNCRDKNRIP